ncbi:MAG: hypothetical protein ACOCP8_04610 [archaeon]
MREKKGIIKNRNSNYILIFILFLAVIFFILLFLSVSKSNIEVNYYFDDDVSFVLNDHSNRIKIGDIEIQNNGVLPKRVVLNSYILCNFDKLDEYHRKFSQPQRVDYTGDSKVKTDIFNYKYNDVIDISSGDYKKISMTFSWYLNPDYFDAQENFQLYLFLNEETDKLNYYDFCDNVDKEDAIKVINVELKKSQDIDKEVNA